MDPDLEEDSASPESAGDQDDFDMAAEQEKGARGSSEHSSNQTNGNGQNKSSNGKEPPKQKRRKARRACAACQRAHLTCGDERPCLRCIKRGIERACQDGVRKKAKYLQDVSADQLMPGVAGHFPNANGAQYNNQQSPVTAPQSASYYPAAPPTSNFEMFNTSNQTPMPPPPLSSNGSFTQHSPTSPSFQSMGSQQSPPVHGLPSIPASSQGGLPPVQPQYAFDPSDPALFNFDIASLNFGNQYGAMEFGMLEHMAGGAADSPSNQNTLMGAMQMPNTYSGSISSTTGFTDGATHGLLFNQDPMIGSEWQRHNSTSSQFNPIRDTGRTESVSSHAYAIGAGPGSITSASPSSTTQEFAPPYDNAPSSPALYASETQRNMYNLKQQQQHQRQTSQYQVSHPQQRNEREGLKPGAFPTEALQSHSSQFKKHPRDHDYIYDNVTAPYAYTEGFHSLFTYVWKHYSTDKRARIARALSEFRPTLINTYSEKSVRDLTFAEIAFQRLLGEFHEKLLPKYSSPTIIVRRDGEVAYATKEFYYLTGWTHDVLVGKEPNLNVNTGGSTGHHTGASTRGAVNTPRLSTAEQESATAKAAKPRPVLIAELLDHESVVQFCEDFARHAYIDASGGEQRPCKLIKYRTKDDIATDANEDADDGDTETEGAVKRVKREHVHAHGLGRIKMEEEMLKLGRDEGTVNCMYTFRIKRDPFDSPMMFIVNFLPVFPEEKR